MNERNIFIALSHYVPRKEHNPSENHFTEAFTYVLNTNKPLLRRILKAILKDNRKSFGFLNSIKGSELNLNTQAEYQIKNKTVRPDIALSVQNKVLILFENKLGAKERKDGEGGTQLGNYIKVLQNKKTFKKRFLVFITLSEENVGKVGNISYFIPVTWSEVYGIINSYKNNQKNQWKLKILESFIQYMEAENMAGFRGFIRKDLNAWVKYENFKFRLNEFMEYLQPKMEAFLGGVKTEQKDNDGWRFLHFQNRSMKTAKIDGQIGFYSWTKDKTYPNYKDGTYCFVCFYTKKDMGWKADSDGKPLSVYNTGRKRIFYDCLLEDIIGKTSPEKQKEKILGFYKKALRELKKSNKYKAMLK